MSHASPFATEAVEYRFASSLQDRSCLSKMPRKQMTATPERNDISWAQRERPKKWDVRAGCGISQLRLAAWPGVKPGRLARQLAGPAGRPPNLAAQLLHG